MSQASAIENMEIFMDRAREKQRFQSEVLHVQVVETLTVLLEALFEVASRDAERLERLQEEVESLGWQDARHMFMVPTSDVLSDMQRLCELLGGWKDSVAAEPYVALPERDFLS